MVNSGIPGLERQSRPKTCIYGLSLHILYSALSGSDSGTERSMIAERRVPGSDSRIRVLVAGAYFGPNAIRRRELKCPYSPCRATMGLSCKAGSKLASSECGFRTLRQQSVISVIDCGQKLSSSSTVPCSFVDANAFTVTNATDEPTSYGLSVIECLLEAADRALTSEL
jgi:hypothetical protein